MKEELSISLSNSLKNDVADTISGLAEVGLDSIMDDELLKEVPFVSTAISIYRIGRSISERHNIKKLMIFLDSINYNTVNKTKREEYIRAISSNPKERSKELEYLLIILDRYITYEKPDMLAKLYLSYLKKEITWKELVTYAEIIDRFIPGDYELLMDETGHYSTSFHNYNESIFRLEALGLIIETNSTSAFHEHSGGYAITPQSLERVSKGVKEYDRTGLGNTFVSIMNGVGDNKEE